MIRSAAPKDVPAILEIYNHYILNSHATFEVESISAEELAGRIELIQSDLKLPWIVSEINGRIIGYAYATKWKARKAYAKTVETSIYLHKDEGGQGYGYPLYAALMDILKRMGYHAIIGGMSLPNEPSRALHEKLGFKKIGEFREVGYKFDRWIDVGYWQLVC